MRGARLVPLWLLAAGLHGLQVAEVEQCADVYPEHACHDVRSCGAVGDGRTNDQVAIRQCAAAVSSAGGGVLWFGRLPQDTSGAEAVFLTGSFLLPSNSVLHVAGGVKILGSAVPGDYPELPSIVTWGGAYYCQKGHYGGNFFRINGRRHAALVRTSGARNVTLTGSGEINGNGLPWWRLCYEQGTRADRPHLVQIENSSDVTIRGGLVFNHTPSWNMHILLSQNVVIRDVSLLNPPTPVGSTCNTDGLDIDSSRNVHVHNIRVAVNDDVVAIKSGMTFDPKVDHGKVNRAGFLQHRPSENVLIENSTFSRGGAMTIGSEMSGGVRNITFRNIVASGLHYGAFIKTRRGRGSHPVENVLYDNITLHNVGRPLNINMWYFCDKCDDCADCGLKVQQDGTPIVRNITFRNFVASGVATAGYICGLAESPLDGLHFKDVKFTAYGGRTVGWEACGNARGSAVNMQPAVPCVGDAHEPKECPKKPGPPRCPASLVCSTPFGRSVLEKKKAMKKSKKSKVHQDKAKAGLGKKVKGHGRVLKKDEDLDLEDLPADDLAFELPAEAGIEEAEAMVEESWSAIQLLQSAGGFLEEDHRADAEVR